MLNKTIALAFSLAVTLGFAQSSIAAEETADTATIIVYRSAESVKTKRVTLGIVGGASTIGRLSANDMVATHTAAGAYTLTTRIAGTEPLTLDLKPGATYYVHAKMKMKGSRMAVDLQAVTEQVAFVQQPALDGAI